MKDFLDLRPYVAIIMMILPIFGLYKVWTSVSIINRISLIVVCIILIIVGIISAYKVDAANDTSTTKNRKALNSILLQSLLFSAYMWYILYLI